MSFISADVIWAVTTLTTPFLSKIKLVGYASILSFSICLPELVICL